MTKTEEVELCTIIDNIKTTQNVIKNNSNEEVANIRKYCIDALTDYQSSVKKICEIIDANRNLIEGRVTEFDNKKYFAIWGGCMDMYFLIDPNTGKKVDIYLDERYFSQYDFVSVNFRGDIGNGYIDVPFTTDIFTKYYLTTETWLRYKKFADNTRKRTQYIVTKFKNYLNTKLEEEKSKLSDVETGGSSVYVKVGM